MYSAQLHKFADTLSNITDKAYDNGKSMFYSSSSQAEQAARSALRSAPVRRAVAYLPMLQSRLNAARSAAGENLTHMGENLAQMRTSMLRHICSTEALSLKLTGVYLLVKWYQNREKDACAMTSSVKNHIIEKPVSSALIALGLGLALGKLRK